MKKFSRVVFFLFIYTQSVVSQPTKSAVLGYEQAGNAALKLVPWDWKKALPNCTIKFGPSRPGFLGLANLNTKVIEIWPRPSLPSAEVASIIMHELAHIFDSTYMTTQRRQQWYQIRKINPTIIWFIEKENQSDYSFGAGDFAESVAYTMQKSFKGFKSKLGPPPTTQQQELIREWLSASLTAGN